MLTFGKGSEYGCKTNINQLSDICYEFHLFTWSNIMGAVATVPENTLNGVILNPEILTD